FGLVALSLGPDDAFIAAFNHSEGATCRAGAAAIADILLDLHRAELSTVQRPGGADVETSGVGAVLADIRGHQPPELIGIRAGTSGVVVGCAVRPRFRRRTDTRHTQVDQSAAGRTGVGDPVGVLLDESHMPPGVGPQLTSVVIGGAQPLHIAVLGVVVPFLAGDFTGLAADADRGIGEERLAGLCALAVSFGA